jgi:predicted ATPase
VKLTTVYARFFRSLNFDFLKRSDPGYRPKPWDDVVGVAPYPFVKLGLDPHITTVVGANESGKSQVLAAIEFGLTGERIVRRDFCRYSPFFLTDKVMQLPEFGLEFEAVTNSDLKVMNEACGEVVSDTVPDRAAIFRMNSTPKLRLYVSHGDQWSMHTVRKSTLLGALGVPVVYSIDAKTPLPDAVPIDYLASGNIADAVGRDSLRPWWDGILTNASWFKSSSTVEQSKEKIAELLSTRPPLDTETGAKYRLADSLLTGVAGLQRELFSELRTAIREGKAGYAKSIVDTVNAELARSLNFKHWWRQDPNFELFVEYQEYDLTFMIRDRTGRSYSFNERSGGLKYFLSYFVQYLSHKPDPDGRPEILLMDEPDAYLSSSGQQDLLKIFEAFAFPEDDDVMPIQVVYVTHSPFLLDKNHAERIRVLEKGRHDEGTRVVANASRNHYEPLRSALGEFVAETSFIGSCNLMLEGVSDQVLIAGMSTWLRARGIPDSQNLDLNAVTIVPAGSASHVPYLAFLARGRDVEKPAVIVLLDGDDAGRIAVKALARGGPKDKQVVAPEFVLQLSDSRLEGVVSDNPQGALGIEDMIPLDIAVAAAKSYVMEFAPDAELSKLSVAPEVVFDGTKGTLDGIEKLARGHLADDEFHIDKIGFARHVIAVLRGGETSAPSTQVVENNFRLLLQQLAGMQREALRRQSEEMIRDRVNRIRDRFETDHPLGARREDVTLLIEEIESQLNSSAEADEARAEMRTWNRRFKLDDDPRAMVDDFEDLKAALTALVYQGTRRVQIDVP